ncbi:nuclear transport factor 2 family protein [Mycobacterium interjectum]|uniref:nuclear transport factor 2 family protein n=1 Tax=Mycobacterium interjectum TaxID=33895 RepID=UPI000A036C68|nr:nuclear transport factor 2 family protein [Mycobacterium interjectum]MCV7091265.1 nuclear transport factor 2 family protein [Mycobacterium interjectum]
MNAHPFRAAVESGELGTIGDLFAEDAVLNSPVAHRPYRGRGAIAAIIAAVSGVLDGFRFGKELTAADEHALMFDATVAGLRIQGCDFLHTRQDGLIDEITVMVRPLRAATVFAERMRAAIEGGGPAGKTPAPQRLRSPSRSASDGC